MGVPAVLAATDAGKVVGYHVHLDTIGLVAALAIGYSYGLRRLAEQYAPRGGPAITT